MVKCVHVIYSLSFLISVSKLNIDLDFLFGISHTSDAYAWSIAIMRIQYTNSQLLRLRNAFVSFLLLLFTLKMPELLICTANYLLHTHDSTKLTFENCTRFATVAGVAGVAVVAEYYKSANKQFFRLFICLSSEVCAHCRSETTGTERQKKSNFYVLTSVGTHTPGVSQVTEFSIP